MFKGLDHTHSHQHQTTEQLERRVDTMLADGDYDKDGTVDWTEFNRLGLCDLSNKGVGVILGHIRAWTDHLGLGESRWTEQAIGSQDNTFVG